MTRSTRGTAMPWSFLSLLRRSNLGMIATGIALLLLSANILLTHASSALDTCGSLVSAPKQERYMKMISAAKAIEDKIIDIRRTLHRRPALMYEEYEAQALVIETLTELGLSTRKMAITGVVSDLGADVNATSSKSPTVVVLRADMDALPIHEETDLTFKSEIDGVMHACGHDTHTAMLLGAAMLLKPFESTLAAQGKVVRFAFQPSEEGGAGGKMMVDQGLLDGASAAFALHTSSGNDVGIIASKAGVLSAATTSWTLTIKGKGGHAAMPFKTIDPVNAAAQVVLSLNTIVGRMVDNPNDPVIIGVSTIHGGDASNIVPEMVVITGTIRASTYEVLLSMKQIVKNRAIDIAAANGCEATVLYRDDEKYINSRGEEYSKASYPQNVNDLSLYLLGMNSAVELFKKEDGTSKLEELIEEVPNRGLGGEDFSFFREKVPTAFFSIGHRSDEKTGTSHHNPKFQVDEAMLYRGAAFYAMLALDYLASV